MARVFSRNDARIPFQRGVDAIARLVAPTYGPGGRAVLSSRAHQAPALLRGGYEIASEVEFDAPGPRAGAAAMRQLAIDVHREVGDGTTLALLLGKAVLDELTICSASGISTPALRVAVLARAEALAAELTAVSRPVTEAEALLGIATRAAGGDRTIGARVCAARDQAGAEGVVLIETWPGAEDQTTVEAGMTFPQAWVAHPFLNDAAGRRLSLDNPLILLYQGAIDSFAAMARVLEMISESGKELLVVADRFGPEAIATLAANRAEHGLKVAPMIAPGAGPWRGHLLEDLAVATGATILGDGLGRSLDSLRPHHLGRADGVEMNDRDVSVIRGHGEAERIRARCEGIRQSIEQERYLSFDREQHQRRLARFVARVATLRLGARTPTERAARLAAAQSAAAALRSVAADGAVPGGAAALVHAAARCAASSGPDEIGRAVARVFAGAARVPLIALAANVGAEGRSIAYRIESDDEILGFDAAARRCVPAATLPEPTGILIAALRGAVSFAVTAQSVEGLIAG